MKTNSLSIVQVLVSVFLLVGLLLGLSISVIYPVWIAASAIIVVLTLLSWYKQGRSFEPLVPLTIVFIVAVAVVIVWLYTH